MTSSEIISLFNTARESYTPIVGPPTYDNIVCLRKAILTIFYYISLGADADCPSGLILTDAAYKCSLGTTMGFDCMISAYTFYDPSIKDDAIDGLRKK